MSAKQKRSRAPPDSSPAMCVKYSPRHWWAASPTPLLVQLCVFYLISFPDKTAVAFRWVVCFFAACLSLLIPHASKAHRTKDISATTRSISLSCLFSSFYTFMKLKVRCLTFAILLALLFRRRRQWSKRKKVSVVIVTAEIWLNELQAFPIKKPSHWGRTKSWGRMEVVFLEPFHHQTFSLLAIDIRYEYEEFKVEKCNKTKNGRGFVFIWRIRIGLQQQRQPDQILSITEMSAVEAFSSGIIFRPPTVAH